MDSYTLVKTLHIISATIVFGTGLGIAHAMWRAHRTGVLALRRFGAALTVRSDFTFTLPAVIIQPATGFWLVWQGGFAWNDAWLVGTYALYLLAALCWVPVVFIQIAMHRELARDVPDDARLGRLYRWWFALGWPAFGGLVVVFWLMVAKPSW